MAYSYIIRTGDGATNTFSISFTLGFLQRSDVKCRVGTEVDGLDNPVYRTITWINDGLVTISGSPPGNGVDVRFDRTVSKSVLKHDYSDGSIIEESNLDESNLQLIMAIHELLDGRIDASGVVIDPGSSVTAEQLTALQDTLQAEIDALQAQVDALSASIDDAIADAIAAAIATVNDTIDTAIADALADLTFADLGGLLQNHAFASYSATTVLSNPMPTASAPTLGVHGTEILSCTITPKAIGNVIHARTQACIHNNVGSRGGIALFINGVFQKNSYYCSGNNSTYFPAGVSIEAEYTTDSLDPVVVKVLAGPYLGSMSLNDTLGGGQSATLSVDEISPAGMGQVGDFVTWS